MNIIIPIGGPNRIDNETQYIKSLQEIESKTVLQYVFESLQDIKVDHFVVVVKREDANKYHLDNIVRLLRPEAEIIIAEGETYGAACTCLLAIDKLDLSQPLLITGSDQLFTVSPQNFIDTFENAGYDAGTVIFDDVHPRWSYVKLDEDNMVVEAAEKRPISRNATAGFFYFKTASLFVDAAMKMISKNANVDGAFYVAPTLNELILAQKSIGTYRIDKAQYYSFRHNSGIDAYKAYLKGKTEV